jgi:hypothetical protein
MCATRGAEAAKKASEVPSSAVKGWARILKSAFQKKRRRHRDVSPAAAPGRALGAGEVNPGSGSAARAWPGHFPQAPAPRPLTLESRRRGLHLAGYPALAARNVPAPLRRAVRSRAPSRVFYISAKLLEKIPLWHRDTHTTPSPQDRARLRGFGCYYVPTDPAGTESLSGTPEEQTTWGASSPRARPRRRWGGQVPLKKNPAPVGRAGAAEKLE